jgi:hypothetical protein
VRSQVTWTVTSQIDREKILNPTQHETIFDLLDKIKCSICNLILCPTLILIFVEKVYSNFEFILCDGIYHTSLSIPLSMIGVAWQCTSIVVSILMSFVLRPRLVTKMG